MIVLRSPWFSFFSFIIILFFSLSFFIYAQEEETGADVEALRREITHEASSELASITLGDSEVSLLTSGYWKGTLQANYGIALTPLGMSAVSPDSPVLFKQEADLTLSLWIRNRWFVEATFLDDFADTSYRTGYQGLDGEPIQYIGIGNTGLDFPAFPYMDLGGDSPSSFGFYGRFGGDAFKVHTLFRYDAAAREERIFVGNRERTFTYVPLQNTLSGRFFVLPDDNLDAPADVYLEDKDGDLRDGRGRRWRRAKPTEYSSGALTGMVELGASPAGMVAVSYSKGGNPLPWLSSLGSYDTPGSGYLAGVQAWFPPAVRLSSYPQPGGPVSASPPGFSRKPDSITLSNGVTALVLLEGGSFSPFERLSRYQAPSSSASDAGLVRLSTRERIDGYEVLPVEDPLVSAAVPLYAETENRRGIYELVSLAANRDRRDPSTLWPMADQYPEVYLPGKGAFTGDLGMRFTNYGNAGDFVIGTDVVPGSVQVYRSGIADSNIRYDASSGIVSLANPAGFNEVIRVTYLRKTNEYQDGSLAAGIGAVYDAGGPFSSKLGIGLRWNINSGPDPKSFSENDVESPGSIGLSGESSWNTDNLKMRISGGVRYEQPDTTGLYRAAGMEGNEAVLSLTADNSFNSWPPPRPPAPFSGLTLDNRSPLVYRNYLNNNALGSSSLMEIDWDGAAVVSYYDKPYPVMDRALTSQSPVLAAEFSLNSSQVWAGFESSLGDAGAILERAREILVPFRFHDFSRAPVSADNFTVTVQFGVLSGEEEGFIENPDLIMEKTMFTTMSMSPPFPNTAENRSSFDTASRILRIFLSDEDRRKLRGARHMRVLITYNGSAELRGRVLTAPPIINGAGFRPIIVSGGVISEGPDIPLGKSVAAVEIKETGTQKLENFFDETVRRLHPDDNNLNGQRVLRIAWENLGYGESAGADGRLGAVPLEDYRTLSFFVKGPRYGGAGETLRFFIGRGPASLADPGEIALDARIPLGAFRSGEWSKVEIRYRGADHDILVDGSAVPGAALEYRSSEARQRSAYTGDTAGGKTAYVAVFVSPSPSGKLERGEFSIDEIILENPSSAFAINGGTSLEWTRKGDIISIGKQSVLSDILLSTAVESAFRGDPFTKNTEFTRGLINRSNGELKFLGALLKGNAAFIVSKDDFQWDAGHGVSRSWGPFSAQGNFSVDPRGLTMDHKVGMELTGAFHSRLGGDARFEENKLTRQWDAGLGYAPAMTVIPSVSVETNALWTENTTEPSQSIENYGKTWVQSWKYLTPDWGGGASKRNTRTTFRINERTSPVGAELLLGGSTAFSELAGTTISENEVRLDVPVELGEYRFLVQGLRSYKRHIRFSGADIWDDAGKFGESLGDALPLWGVVPFYSIFAEETGGAMDRSLANSPSAFISQYAYFDDRFAFSLRFPSGYGLSSLYVPESAAFSIDRVLEHKLDTRVDVLNVTSSLGFSAVNMFGAFGVLPLFQFYASDEIGHSLEASAAFPRSEDPSWRLQSAVNLNFLGFIGAELGIYQTFTASNTGWLESFRSEWTVPTKNSLLSIFYGWISRALQTQSTWLTLADFLNTDYEQLRKESLELAFDHSGDYLQWGLTAGHESIIRILGQLNFSVFAKLECLQNYQSSSLSFIGTIGTTLNVSF